MIAFRGAKTQSSWWSTRAVPVMPAVASGPTRAGPPAQTVQEGTVAAWIRLGPEAAPRSRRIGSLLIVPRASCRTIRRLPRSSQPASEERRWASTHLTHIQHVRYVFLCQGFAPLAPAPLPQGPQGERGESTPPPRWATAHLLGLSSALSRLEAKLGSQVWRKGRDAGLCHQAGLDQPAGAGSVGGSPVAARPTPAPASDEILRVDAFDLAIDPAEAKGFVESRVVVKGALAGALLVVDQPDLRPGLMVLGQPGAPGLAGLNQQGLAYLHGISARAA